MVAFKYEEKIREWIGKQQLYFSYRYKKRTVKVNPKTGKLMIPQPYIKKEDESDHPFALTYSEWSKTIDEYFKLMTERLIEGETIVLPRDMGELVMLKQKCNPKKKSGKIYRNSRTMGYRPWLAWFRKSESRLIHKFWFSSLNISRKKLWPLMGKKLRDEPETIFKYPTAR